MSKLLQRANAALELCKIAKSKIADDDSFLDAACFQLQQSIEFSLKALIELNGSNYIQNHDVRAQLNKLSSLQMEVPHATELRNMAITINSWETDSRYKDSFLASYTDVELAISYAEDLIRFAKTVAGSAATTPSKIKI